jgi:hypothetical protein
VEIRGFLNRGSFPAGLGRLEQAPEIEAVERGCDGL